MSRIPDQTLNLDRDDFLAHYWQRKPLLIRNALPDFQVPFERDELAGLALEVEVESRLIEYREGNWHLLHGPFSESDFQRQNPWTLLVQAVDHYIPEVAALRRLMGFIPQWRMDDVMMSYATDGGSVGPHYDNYDVFLLQSEGQRLWKLGQACDDTTALLPHSDLRILNEFKPHTEYLLDPGDMLYVPPGVAHWGVARGECTTISIGFRAPDLKEMLSRWVDHLLEELPADRFFVDGGRELALRPGEIATADLARVASQIADVLANDGSNHWFGELVTEPRYAPCDENDVLDSETSLIELRPTSLALRADAKLAWQQDGDTVLVFANGESLPCSTSVLPSLLYLCGQWKLEGIELQQAIVDADTGKLLDWLLQTGVIDV